MFVKPAKGRAPRDPGTMLRIPPTGQSVPEHDPHWAILLRDGDVEEAAEPSEPAPAPAAPEPPAAEAPAAPSDHE